MKNLKARYGDWALVQMDAVAPMALTHHFGAAMAQRCMKR